MENLKSKITEIIYDGIDAGGCDSCTKELCEECFEGSMWDLSKRRCDSIAGKILKLMQKEEN